MNSWRVSSVVRLLVGLVCMSLLAAACSSGISVEAEGGSDTSDSNTSTSGDAQTDTADGSAADPEPAPDPEPESDPEPDPEPETDPEPDPDPTPVPEEEEDVVCVSTESSSAGDFNGDGASDVAGVWARDGVTRLLWCLEGVSSGNLQLPAGVWYVAVFDIEGDGRDELMIGMQDLADYPLPGFEVQLFNIGPDGEMRSMGLLDGDAPYLFVQGAADPSLRFTYGLDCADVDDDGARDLVWVVGEGSVDGSTIAWTRQAVVFDEFGASTGETESGSYTLGTDDDAIARLGRLNCDDESIRLRRHVPDNSLCESTDDIFFDAGDFDGDGAEDLAYSRRREVGTFMAIGVCTAADGAIDEVVVGGQGTVFGVRDLDQDGISEVWSGDSTMPAGAWSAPHLLVDGRLAPLLDDNADPLYMGDGWLVGDDTGSIFLYYLGCGDIDDNGINEIVSLVAQNTEPGTVEWVANHYEVFEGRAILVDSPSGQLAGSLDTDLLAVDDDLGSALDAEANTCG